MAFHDHCYHEPVSIQALPTPLKQLKELSVRFFCQLIPCNHVIWLLFLIFVVLIGWTTPLLAVTEESEEKKVAAFDLVWRNKQLHISRIDAVMDALTKSIGAIPTDVGEQTPLGRKKVVMHARLDLLTQLKESLLRHRELTQVGSGAGITTEIELDNELKRLEKRPPPEIPSQPNLEEFGVLEKKFNFLLKEVERLSSERARRRQLLQRIPEMILLEKGHQQDAAEELRKVESLRGQSKDAEKVVLDLRAENADLVNRLTEERIALWGLEEAYEKNFGSRLDKELEVSQNRLKYEEKRFNLYQEALNQQQKQALQVKANALEQKEQQAKQAETQVEKFFAQWEVRVALTQKNSANWRQLRTLAASEIAEYERKLKEEKSELEKLQALVNRLGSHGMAAELLKSTFRLIGQRRRDLERGNSGELREKLAAALTRSIEVEAMLPGLRDQWQAELTTLLAEVTDEKHQSELELKARHLLDIYKSGLRDEKTALFEINVEQRRLDLLAMERVSVLDGLERFVLSNVFWIQDAEPVGMELAWGVLDEIGSLDHPNSVVRWLGRLFSPDSVRSMITVLGKPIVAFYGLVLLSILIAMVQLTRKWLHQSVEVLSAASIKAKRSTIWVKPLLAALADAAFWPLNLLFAAWALGVAGLPEGVGTVLSRILMHWALFFFLFRLNRLVFFSSGLAKSLFEMPNDLAMALFSFFRVILISYPILLMPWIIFRGPPFEFIALPRLGYTAYELTAAMMIFLLIRPTSPLIHHAFGETGRVGSKKQEQGIISKHWGMFSGLIFLFLIAVVTLDVFGYRFGAAYLTQNGLLTLVTLFVLIGAHHLFLSFALPLVPRNKPLGSAPPGEFARESRVAMMVRLRKFIRLVFIIIGALILSSYWGINEQTLNALNNYTMFSASQADGRIEIVSAADLVRFCITVILVIWLVRNLSGVLELTLFQQWNVDQGMRYAILTISRYIVVLIGLPWALAWLHVDLGKIAWLAAAISVGIGFGLQEIVANFISGIILLVERPVRVGDRITVGGTRGEVRRINIRATTVINRDQQEIIIPNRDLITKEVINWTLTHNHVRLKIPVGVAYGSDVEKVRRLLLEVASQDPEVLDDPPSRAFFMLHGSSSLDFELRVFYRNPDNLGRLTDRLNTAINKIFCENQVEIPFSQHDLHIRSGLPLSGMVS